MKERQRSDIKKGKMIEDGKRMGNDDRIKRNENHDNIKCISIALSF